MEAFEKQHPVVQYMDPGESRQRMFGHSGWLLEYKDVNVNVNVQLIQLIHFTYLELSLILELWISIATVSRFLMMKSKSVRSFVR